MSKEIYIPSFASNFARNESEAKYPDLWKSLLGLWCPFIGRQNTKLIDLSTCRHDGVMTNLTSTDWIPSPYGSALHYPTGRWIDCGQYVITPKVSIAKNLTMECLFTTDNRSATRFMCGKPANVTHAPPYTLMTLGQLTSGLVVHYNAPTYNYLGVASSLTNNKWHHGVATYNGVTLKLYLDGKILTTRAVSGDMTYNPSPNTNFFIGKERAGSSENWLGKIARTSVYNRALTEKEVALLYSNPYAHLEVKRKIYGMIDLTPTKPTNVAAVSHNKYNTITWDSVVGATSYNLYWSYSSPVTKITGTKITGVTSPYNHTGLTNGTPYYYVVTAENITGESEISDEVTATPIGSTLGTYTTPILSTSKMSIVFPKDYDWNVGELSNTTVNADNQVILD